MYLLTLLLLFPAACALLTMDAAALAVLFAVELALLGFGEVAIVVSLIDGLAVFEFLFALFQVVDLPRGQRTVLDAVLNSPLLAIFAAVDLIDPRVAGINWNRGGGILRPKRRREGNGNREEEILFHDEQGV